mgnify:CR=1 FL=1
MLLPRLDTAALVTGVMSMWLLQRRRLAVPYQKGLTFIM